MKLPEYNLPEVSVRYPAKTVVFSDFGTIVTQDLKRTQGVLAYQLIFTEGTLSGGTSPTWGSVAFGVPFATHLNITADNETIVDADTVLLEELEYMVEGVKPDGTYVTIFMCDRDFRTGNEIPVTLFPSWVYNQITLSVTLDTIAHLTTGSPTGTSTNSSITIVEKDVPRGAVNFKTIKVKQLQVNATASSQTSDNDLTTLLAQTGAYKAFLMFASPTAAGTYASGSDSVFTNIDIILNDVATVRSDVWSNLKKMNTALFGFAPDTGFAFETFMPDNEASKLLDLSNTRAIRSVDVRVHNAAAATEYLAVLKIVYQ